MSEKLKVQALTPAMKMLLSGGGATAFYEKKVPLKMGTAPKLGTTVDSEKGVSPVELIAARNVPILGQTQPTQAPAQQQPAATQDATPSVTKCPGPVVLPDGRILEPDDYIRLSDLCEIMPTLMNTMRASMAPGQQVRVAGGIPGVQGVPTPGMFSAGAGPLGPYAQGAAGKSVV